jgi:hypothetical protein
MMQELCGKSYIPQEIQERQFNQGEIWGMNLENVINIYDYSQSTKSSHPPHYTIINLTNTAK